jgi:molybdate transport system substrate-binding protein
VTRHGRLAALTAGGRFAGLTSRGRLAGVVAALVVVSAGCTSESRLASGSAPRPATTTVTVLGAASLTEPLTALARRYERTHKGVTVALSFGSSTTLAQQVAEGAPADVVAFAGTPALDLLPKDVSDDGDRATIARNTMEIATPPDNPGRVRDLADLSIPSLDVVLCASTVPCGKAADTVLSRAGITPHVVSREVDVKATLAKVRLGEADAALVYHSDVVSAGDSVRGVPIAEAQNTTLDYPMVWLNRKRDTTGFAHLVRGPEGRAALGLAGFLAP